MDDRIGEFYQDTLHQAQDKVMQIMKFIDSCSIMKDGFEILTFNKALMKNERKKNG
jgi:hypothetical protein